MAIKQRLRPVFILAILCFIGGGIWLWQSKRQMVSDSELLLYGNVDIRQVELAFNDSERIADLLVEEGDHLKKGQLLAKLETERFELAVARADAQVKTQEQVVARLEAGTRPEEIRKAKADVAAAAAAQMAAQAEQEEAEETVSVQYSGEPLEIGFNVSYLLDVLGVLSGEKVKLSLSDPNSSALLEESDAGDSVYVVMPMRL